MSLRATELAFGLGAAWQYYELFFMLSFLGGNIAHP
jgi:hypothetical protein